MLHSKCTVLNTFIYRYYNNCNTTVQYMCVCMYDVHCMDTITTVAPSSCIRINMNTN